MIMKKQLLILGVMFFLVLTIGNISAQSIGVSPQKENFQAFRYDESKVSVTIGNGAGYEELVTVIPDEDYKWLKISRNNFTIRWGSQENVELTINTRKLGEFKGRIKFCAKKYDPTTQKGLSSEACSYYTLTVQSLENPNKLKVLINSPITWIILVIILIIVGVYWRKKR